MGCKEDPEGIKYCSCVSALFAMDHLVSDLFDFGGAAGGIEAAALASVIVDKGVLLVERAARSPAVAANLAFHEAWRSVLGVHPTRADFGDFVARLQAQMMQIQNQQPAVIPVVPSFWAAATAGATWSAATAGALNGALATRSPLRISGQAQQLLEAAAAAYQRCLLSLSAEAGGTSPPALHLRLLSAKLRDRFMGSDTALPPTTGDALLTEYATLAMADPGLAMLEAWAASAVAAPSGATSGADGEPATRGTRGPATSVAEYYERTGRAVDRLGLRSRDPITGCVLRPVVTHLAARYDAPPFLSCVEAVRGPVVGDGYLWRCDAGGTMILTDLGAAGASGTAGCVPERGVTYRRLRAPARLVLAALPSRLYSSVLLQCLPEAVAGVRAAAGDPKSIAPMLLLDAAPVADAAGSVVGICWTGPTAPGPEVPLTSLWFASDHRAFGDTVRPAPWCDALRAAMVSDLIKHTRGHGLAPCPAGSADAAKPTDASGVLLFQQFVARYAAVRRLGERVHVTAPAPPVGSDCPGGAAPRGEVVLIDSRRNVWSVLALLVTLDNLRCAEWGVTVFCAEGNRRFMESAVLPHVPHTRVETLEALEGAAGGAGDSAFDTEGYNRLLKDAGFWRRLGARAPLALLVQDDGLIVRRGLDDDAMLEEQDYVGAPWDPSLKPGYLEELLAAGVGPTALVGNGGLSLRRVAAMATACDAGGAKEALFNSNLQPVPEDVFFAAAVNSDASDASDASASAGRNGGAQGTLAAARRFAFEEVLPPTGSPATLGLHKPWPYVPRAALAAFLTDALREAAARA